MLFGIESVALFGEAGGVDDGGREVVSTCDVASHGEDCGLDIGGIGPLLSHCEVVSNLLSSSLVTSNGFKSGEGGGCVDLGSSRWAGRGDFGAAKGGSAKEGTGRRSPEMGRGSLGGRNGVSGGGVLSSACCDNGSK